MAEQSRWVLRPWALTVVLAAVLGMATGCSRLRPALQKEYVYVVAKQTFLRDRVAAVSNRTATVENGDKLQVIERGRRFIRVQTEKGEQGWIDEKVVATQGVYDGFDDLTKQHGREPSIASAVVRDEVYLHLRPGRDTERLFRLSEGEKLRLLRRATLEKALPPGQKLPIAATPVKAINGAKGEPIAPAAPAGPAMEDWWLVQDSHKRTGWLLSRMMDVDAPDTLTRYSEGQRFVGAYVLNRVNDPEAPMDDKNVPEYVTVLSPYKAGLPYDFDQVRVFIWNAKKHRYETGFRERNIEGYLPVKVEMAADPYGKPPAASVPAPTFSYRVLAADAPAVVPDATTGSIAPTQTFLKTYRLEGNLVRRLIAPGTTPPEPAHPEPVKEKKHAVGKSGRRRR